MLVGVCDLPGAYAFPPSGYGGIERWLWAVAVGAVAYAGFCLPVDLATLDTSRSSP